MPRTKTFLQKVQRGNTGTGNTKTAIKILKSNLKATVNWFFFIA